MIKTKKTKEVIYKGSSVTFHPKLGKLTPNEPFVLNEKIANKYISLGLIEEIDKTGE